ncbi:MAG: hypothetical protein PGN23_08655 [Sphingomonas adhaesiva]|uniref:hypothetical protein n=1 Tax=Sphingomonas adhaesiva TaxID=28212 RepID=UPI002FF72578
MRSRFLAWPLGGLILAATPVVAQQAAPVATATTLPPEAGAVPPPISVAPVLPTPAPTVAVPAATPRAVPGPRPTATPTPRAAETPRPAETPRARPTVAVTPTPSPSPTPVEVPSPTPTPVATVPVAVPTPAPIPPAAEEPRANTWLFPGALVLVLAVVAGVSLARRRKRADDVPVEEEVVPIAPPVSPPPAVAVEPRAWLAFELRPRRAGVNLLTATLDAQLTVRNEGDAVADDVRIEIRLLSARDGQDDELAAVFAEPGGRPAAAPFALAPGEERVVDVLATLSREAINVLSAGGRPMFVPVAAVSVRYASGAVRGQTAGAFAIGVEREGAAKLLPFWLDGPGRMFDSVAARPHGATVRR